MKLIVDANIIFSGILNSNGKIGDLLINHSKQFDFIAPNFLRAEIIKHRSKIYKISGFNEIQLEEAEFQNYKGIHFISEEQIKKSAWLFAQKMTDDIDPKDTLYVAFSKHFGCKIWSGDKKLINGLSKKGFTNFINSDELYRLINKKIKK